MKYIGHIVFAVLFATGMLTAQLGHASGLSVDVELEGWAWSSTIGWISMNCKNTTNCASDGGFDYAVSVNTDSTVTGDAWSPNIGWIRFGGLSGFPSGAGTSANDARVTGSYPNLSLEGWARACAGTATGDCTTMADATGGWDGWISLDGAGYGIDFDSDGAVSGSFAWGNLVVGWISWAALSGSGYKVTMPQELEIAGFSAVIAGPPPISGIYSTMPFNITIVGIPDGDTVNYELFIDGTLAADGFVTGDSTGTNTFTVNISNVPYTASGAELRVDNDPPPNGNVTPEVDEDNTLSSSLSLVQPPPEITLDIVDDENFIRRGGSVGVEWSVEAPYVVTCELVGPGLSRTITTTGGAPGAPVRVPASGLTVDTVTDIESTTEFVMRCNDDAATEETSPTVNVIPDSQEI